jgi:hypothetical protein
MPNSAVCLYSFTSDNAIAVSLNWLRLVLWLIVGYSVKNILLAFGCAGVLSLYCFYFAYWFQRAALECASEIYFGSQAFLVTLILDDTYSYYFLDTVTNFITNFIPCAVIKYCTVRFS